MHIPPGFSTLTPYMFVDGAPGFVEFLVQGLGVKDPCGNVWWISQRLEDGPYQLRPSLPFPDGSGVRLSLKVVPGASRSGVAGRLGDRVKVKVTEQAEGGKANAAVIAVLAAALGLPRSDLRIVAGGQSPMKVVEIASLPEDEVFARLADFGV